MPIVDGKKYPYTPEGKAEAKKAAAGKFIQQGIGAVSDMANIAAQRNVQQNPLTMKTGPFKMKYGKSSFPFKSSPAKGTPSATHTHPHAKALSHTEKLDIEDKEILAKHQDPTKTGGKGSRPKDQPTTTKSIKRQIVRESYDEPRSELKKHVKGSKLKKFLTSTKKLRSEASARQLREAKARGQAKEREDI